MNKLKYVFLSLIIGFTAQAMEQADVKLQLALAVMNGNISEVKKLIQAGVGVDALIDNYRPLGWAVWHNREQVVRLLLDLGADVNKLDNLGEAPLHRASWKGSLPIVQCLINAGANLNTKDFAKGTTPLMEAISEKHYEVAQLLVGLGAHVCEKNWWGNTTLIIAAKLDDLRYAELVINRLMQIPNDAQRKNILTLLCCLKKIDFLKALYPKLKSPLLQAIAQENREHPLQSVACREMKKIKNLAMKKILFEQYWPGMVSEAEQGDSWCTIC